MLVAGAAAALCAGLLTAPPAFADTTPTEPLSQVQDEVNAFTGETGVDLVTLTGDVTADDGDRLAIPADTAITLDLHGFALTITQPAAGQAAIRVPSDATLIIEDTTGGGTLTAIGGTGTGASSNVGTAKGDGGGAGIGGDGGATTSADGGAGGAVTITGGTVTATGGGGGAATAIGGGLTALGGGGGAGIGGGGARNALGSGGDVTTAGSGGAVTITGGTVMATGGRGGAATATGDGMNFGISYGGGGGAGIGGGGSSGDMTTAGSGGAVTITGGTLSATGGAGGAGTRGSPSTWIGGGGAGIGGGGSVDRNSGAGGTVANGGTILADTPGTGPNHNGVPAPVTGRNYSLTFDLNGGTGTAPGPLHVYAATIHDAQQQLPAGPTPPVGAAFLGWYTAATGGSQVTDTTDLTSGGTVMSTTGTPVTIPLYAHYAAAPAAPTDLAAQPGYGQITLSWAQPADDGGAPITGYNIYQGTTAGGQDYTTPINETSVTGTQMIVTGLANGTTYYFTVKAVNTAGESSPSTEAHATTAAVCPPPPFPDVDSTSTFCADIAWLQTKNITLGFVGNQFGPTTPVSRQAMAAFLHRLTHQGQDATDCPTPTPFPDVTSTNEFCGDIAWLKTRNITQGTTDNQFEPTTPVSRKAMAAFLHRLTHDGQDATDCPTPTPFPDVDATSIFCGDIAWLKTNHITQGTTDNLFEPTTPVSRQAMAAFLHRLRNHETQIHP